jgi:hypothetical protein
MFQDFFNTFGNPNARPYRKVFREGFRTSVMAFKTHILSLDMSNY